MIEDYRKQLTESLQDELANNKDLQDALNSIKSTMLNSLKT